MPALPDGRHDPMDPRRNNRVVQVRAIGHNTVEFIGCDQAVFGAIRTLGARHQRAPRGGAWLLPQTSAEDVAALLEHRGYTLAVTL